MIPYSTSHTDGADVQAAIEVLRSKILTRGQATLALEDKMCEISGKKYSVAVSNGTVAILAALEVAQNLDTYSPTLTFSAVANASYYFDRHLPILYDVDVNTLATDWKTLAGLDGSVVAMDYAGYPTLDSRPPHFVGTVILDAAHSIGATLADGTPHTKYADLVTYSFHPAKLATTAGEGGCVCTDNDEYANHLRAFRNNGFAPGTHNHTTFGINAHMTEVQAAFGLSQLQRLKTSIKRRHEIANFYYHAWRHDVRVILPAWHKGHVWHLFVIRFSEYVKCDMPTFQAELKEKGIIAQRHYRPLHLQPIYDHIHSKGDFLIAEHAYERMLSIPMFYGLGDSDVGHVITSINQVLDKYSG